MKHAITNYMKSSTELTKYNVNVATHPLRLDFKCVHAEESWKCQMKCRQYFKQLIAYAYMTFQRTRGAKHGAQPWQKHHFIAKGFMRKIHKKERKRRFLTASRMMMYLCKPATTTGQKNGANIWITSEQSIIRTMSFQNNWNDTLFFSIFGTIRNKWRKALWKVVQIIIKLRGPIGSMNKETNQTQRIKKTTQLSRGSGPREVRLAYMALTQVEMVLCGEPNLRCKFHTKAQP